MAEMTPRTLSGFMELLPKPQQQMERMMEILRRTYSLYGFTPLDTPVIEAAEVLLAKGGGETEKQIYRFNKGDADLALRFDLTVPLAKYVALHYNDLSFPFRRYQIGKVYRGERAQRGRFREFYQADIDVIGDGKLDITNEAEMPAIIYRAFSELGLRRFCIRVNNRKVLNGFYAMLGLTDKAGDIMRTVDKLDKIGAEKVRTLLTDEVGVSAESADEILKFIAITGSNDQVLSALEGYAGRNETFDEGLDQLKTVVKYLSAFGVPEENFAVDLTIARGLDYYTGTVYEKALLAGICMDTKFFNVRTGERTFEAAAALRRMGADTTEVKLLMQNDFQGTVAKYQIVRSARLYRGELAIAALNYETNRILAAQAADDMLNISGITASFVLFPDNGQTIISARSIGKVNVQVILEELGGGGNAMVAGAQMKDTPVDQALDRLVEAIDKFYEG